MLLRVLTVVLAGAIFTAATCVTVFEAQGPSGPWTGEFQHLKEFDANYFEWNADVRDNDGDRVGGLELRICPHAVGAGGIGAFELIAPAVAGGPLSARAPNIDGYWGDPSFPQEGLSAQVEATSGPTSVMARVTNDRTGEAFSNVIVCGVAREAELRDEPGVVYVPGAVVSVSPEVALDEMLMPGNSREVALTFTRHSGIPALIDVYAAGVPVAIQEEHPDGSFTIDTGPFDVTLPEGWSYIPRQGTDSFVGEFRKNGVDIFFDYGWYNGDLTEYEDDPAYAFSHETIDERDAVVVTPLGSATGVTAAHIDVKDDVGPDTFMRTTILLYGDNVPQSLRAEALSIFRSLKFEEGWD